jgi:hypothetical protein
MKLSFKKQKWALQCSHVHTARDMRTGKMPCLTFMGCVDLHFMYLECFALAISADIMCVGIIYVESYLHLSQDYQFLYCLNTSITRIIMQCFYYWLCNGDKKNVVPVVVRCIVDVSCSISDTSTLSQNFLVFQQASICLYRSSPEYWSKLCPLIQTLSLWGASCCVTYIYYINI